MKLLLLILVLLPISSLCQTPRPATTSPSKPSRSASGQNRTPAIRIKDTSITPKAVESVTHVRGAVIIKMKTGQTYRFTSREIEDAWSRYGRIPVPRPSRPVAQVDDDDDDDDPGAAWWIWAAVFGGAIAGMVIS